MSAPTHRRVLGAACDLAISTDSRLLAATTSRSVVLHDLATGRRLAAARLSNASSVDFSPDGARLVVRTTSGEQRLYAVPDMAELTRFDGDGIGEGPAARFTADGHRTVQASWDGDVVVREGEREVHRERHATWMFDRLVRHPADGRLLLAGHNQLGTPRAIALFAIADDGALTERFRPEQPLGDFAVASTGTIASRAGRHAVVVRDRDGRELSRRELGPDRSVEVAAWSPDGQELLVIEDEIRPDAEILGDIRAIASGNPRAPRPKTFQAYTADLEPTWSLPVVYACDAAYTPDGTRLVLGSWERGVVLDR
jgi:dipeptidyl aminopeptidase/acylaminoacyl peptidase